MKTVKDKPSSFEWLASRVYQNLPSAAKEQDQREKPTPREAVDKFLREAEQRRTGRRT
jgi:hypothetical protein